MVGALLLPAGAFAASREVAVQALDFGDWLTNHKEYYRGITEYQRALFLAGSDDSLAAEAILGVVRAYALARQHTQAIDWLLEKGSGINRPAARERADALLFRCYIEAGDESSALALVEDSTSSRSLLFRGVALSHAARWPEATDHFRRLRSDPQYGPVVEHNLRVVERGQAVHRLSPSTARILGILPGAGYLYARHPRSAMSAFLFNSLLIAGTVQAFRGDQPYMGTWVGLLALSWHASSIYGAGRAAIRYNTTVHQGIVSQLHY